MAMTTQTTTTSYVGTNAEIDKSLAELFPQVSLKRPCKCAGQGVGVSNQYSIYDKVQKVLSSVTVKCLACHEIFAGSGVGVVMLDESITCWLCSNDGGVKKCLCHSGIGYCDMICRPKADENK